MDYGRSLTFMFEDPNWIGKMLIGALLILLGTILLPVLLIGLVLFLPLSGYMLKLVRQIMNGGGDALPEWDNFGDLLAEGFKLAAAWFIYGIPLLILEIPLLLSTLFTNGNHDVSVFGAFVSSSCGCLVFIYSILLALVAPIILILLAKENRFGAAFDFNAIWDILKSHLGEIVIIVVIDLIAGLVAGIVGSILLLIGLFFTSFWVILVEAHLAGQLGRLAFAPAAALPGEGQPSTAPPAPPAEKLPGAEQPPAPEPPEPPRPPSEDA